jgi:cytochrome c-type biogenesis protein
VAQGAYLLLVYSLGLGVPFIVTGLAVVPVTAYLKRFRNVMPLIEITMGVLMFLDDLTIFNRYFDVFGLSEV